ncbi:hypothetical protein OS493_017487 [Desmophyllum pertusum]|uniref:Uncharacterized protein n=1 Tax=Desmophyllum pertusum TaxID=174260 RepID=A0A9W9ZQR6_9CNID|nr:hypothetical protein OS493_017487 [Desmophyllum pertusum]
MGESADALPFSVANILKGDLSKGVKKPGQSLCNASKALTLAERLAVLGIRSALYTYELILMYDYHKQPCYILKLSLNLPDKKAE